MRLVELLLDETRTSLRRLGMMAAVAGISNAALLAIVNNAAGHIKDGQPQLTSVVLFLLFILAYVYSQRYVLLTTSAEIERLVHSYRERLVGRLKMCELREVEHIGRGRIFSSISSDTRVISQTANALVMGAQSALLIVFACVYLATISMTSLVLSAIFLSIAIAIYQGKMQGISNTLRDAAIEENQLHDLVNGLLDGFKEVKLSSRRAAAVLADVLAVSDRTAVFRTIALQSMGVMFIFAQTSFLLLLGTLVFLTPMFGSNYSGTVMESMTTVIFLIGPISGLVGTIPQIAVANSAAENLYNLEQLLESSIHEKNGRLQADRSGDLPAAMTTLELRQVFFSHVTKDSQFDVGPINLTIREGETIFITGGNGSGKSTLIKLLTGLYSPLSGELLVNGAPVTMASAQAFRDRFCAVFSDFHLFRKLYGIAMPDAAVANAWLEEMEITGKTEIGGDGFSTVDLSAGQRKRLALISALLEDKPIVVLDEWAADQDPHFRRKFYDELLPRMKADGKTIIAVTHDDRYFHVADRHLHMEEGKLHDLTENLANG
ncbi:MAG: cyclic peptide export ABC transporter [Sulfuricella sp.]|nr:cyclic peptide export ABC transporter [Sulfuricella sp.]